MRAFRVTHRLGGVVILLVGLGLMMSVPSSAEAKGGLAPLNTVPVPLPPNLGDFVQDIPAAIELGKALFWDQQAGGDGIQACASCHFQAGSDARAKNTLNPGFNGTFETAPAGATLTAAKFPMKTGDVGGSQGIMRSNFRGLGVGAVDDCQAIPDSVFSVGGNNVRQVTGRKAPSAVNAVFYNRNFWDGRADNTFNGVTPFGPNDSEATLYKVVNGVLDWVFVAIPNASLASQAVGPPNNAVEMSCGGRSFPMLGRKMLGLPPLGLQVVAPTDSVLGVLSLSPGNGLNTTYAAMIQAAFKPEWWASTDLINGFTQMEQNFSLYWGLSIMLYESTLVSDDTPVDRFLAGNNAALNAQEQQGLKVFTGKGRCDKCHFGGELTEASVGNANGDPLKGFINVGVRPNAQDGGDILQPGKGMYKVPAPRNAELNGPYFHNGSRATLRQVVDFYDAGGDFPGPLVDRDVRRLRLTEAEKNAVVAFLVALTDDRVRFEKAPFDHPSLDVANLGILPAVGATGRSTPVTTFLALSPFQP